eukprot:TRINITY_DN5473_c0_g1_i6.p1 TRINITY_DN5473_c0_g1~~TRINITY_DN5473_c0_g1_i6.p1  ORF type:complete len:294 (+),score=60.60 TRINITY_DN5473_c0_g1_i6:244-1125(+)
MEKIWHYVFQELRVATEERAILLTEAPYNPRANREKMSQMLFEKFNAAAVQVAIPGILSLYALGRSCGLTIDIGDSICHTTPIYEGYTFPQAIRRMDLAGRDLTDFMLKIINTNNNSSLYHRETARGAKEMLACVALDFEKEMKTTTSNSSSSYLLPDGQALNIGNEKWKCGEMLFQPAIADKQQYQGIHEMVYDSIMDCDVDVRRFLLRNIMISGGTTMIPGISARLQKEVTSLTKQSTARVRIVASDDRNIAVWIGGSIIASLSSFDRHWIRKADYDEHGASIFFKKCFFV